MIRRAKTKILRKLAQLSVPNRLSESTSPYLLQHAENPVDWYPWGQEAFDEAKRRDVPIFLSVGYSACHWCHVMAHESFENENVAALLNAGFVNIKVDREELPAVDSLYMQATQAMSGHGGWPMSVWLDHDRKPWYAGTYFPATPSHGMPSFTQVVLALGETWANERERVSDSANRIMQAIGERGEFVSHDELALSKDSVFESLKFAVTQLANSFDPINGGFGGAPKFPSPMVLEFLMRFESYLVLNNQDSDPRITEMVNKTFERMARGGIYDQLVGGFARYSVDDAWLIPHFEKMLYDNAQLLSAYTSWYRISGNPLAKKIIEETVSFLIAEMQTPEGGFASALDADSFDVQHNESREGAFYAWTLTQLIEALGEHDGKFAVEYFGVTESGNFEEGASVLTQYHDSIEVKRIENIRQRLIAQRNLRERPGRDDKIVASWNGLTIQALVQAGTLLNRKDWIESAVQAADLLITVHLGGNPDQPSRLVRVSRDGVAGNHAPGVLEDQANVANAFLALAQAQGDVTWLDLAGVLLHDIQTHFVQGEGLVDTADDAPSVIEDQTQRQMDPTDNVTPSGWSGTAQAALTYAALTGDLEMFAWAEKLLAKLVPVVRDHPRFAGWTGANLVAWLDGPREIAIVASPDSPMVQELAWGNAPGLVYSLTEELPLGQGRNQINNLDTAYVCRNFVCEAPTTEIAEFKKSIGSKRVSS